MSVITVSALVSNPYINLVLGAIIGAGIFFIVHKVQKKRMGNALEQTADLYTKLSELINFAVAPKFIEVSLGANDLIDHALEIWRLEQRLRKCFDSLAENQRKGLEISLEKLKRYTSKYDIELLDYTNQKFNEGLNLDVLSIEKDTSLPTSIVKETIEPTVLCKGQVVRKAKIIVLSNR